MCDKGYEGPNAKCGIETHQLRAMATILNFAADTLETRLVEIENECFSYYISCENLRGELREKDEKIKRLEEVIRENDNG